MLIKLVVHIRTNPVRWAVWTSPFFFLVAGTVCCLTIVYKGSPKLGLDKKPAGWVAGVTVGTGAALALLAFIFFLPFVHAKVIKKDQSLKWWNVIQGPLLWRRSAPEGADVAKVPNFAVIQHGPEDDMDSGSDSPDIKGQTNESVLPTESDHSAREKRAVQQEVTPEDYKRMMTEAEERHHAYIRTKKNPLGWAMRVLHNNPMGAGALYEWKNLRAMMIRLPAYPVVALLYGTYYDIHSAQLGIEGTPDGKRMAKVYAHAPKYANEVEYLYSFVQIITACTASFAHGANDVGNAVGVWAGMYAAWRTGEPAASKEEVPLWQIAVITLTLCFGFMTYGYNIMKGQYIPFCLDYY